MDLVVGVLDIGGTHVTAALADVACSDLAAESAPVNLVCSDLAVETVVSTARSEHTRVSVRAETASRHELRSDGTADKIIQTLVRAGLGLELAADAWLGIAIPGPFDLERGIGRFHSVGKFDALNGVDVRTPLARGLGVDPEHLVFTMDSHAFLRGEWVAGAARGHHRAVGITLGTGVGSAFLADGKMVAEGNSVPPEGRADLLEIGGRPLEETVSRRALLTAYKGDPHVDVRDLFERARTGEQRAADVIDTAITELGGALGPWFDRFGATVAVVGGAMSGSWDIIEPLLWRGLVAAAPGLDGRLELRVAAQRELSLLVGAAWQCAQVASASRRP